MSLFVIYNIDACSFSHNLSTALSNQNINIFTYLFAIKIAWKLYILLWLRSQCVEMNEIVHCFGWKRIEAKYSHNSITGRPLFRVPDSFDNRMYNRTTSMTG